MAMITKAYLILYNLACCAGWAAVWYLVIEAVLVSEISDLRSLKTALAAAYGNNALIDQILVLVQSAAILEIAHAILGLVRSPVLVTAMQVGSRIAALFAVHYSKDAQNQWGAALMMLSWASVEVPRYLFYVMGLLTGDATKNTPYLLFWLRYSLFAVLYPSGILGEITVFLSAAHDPEFAARFESMVVVYQYILPAVYVVGSPFMIFNMAMNRKSAFKKRFAKPPPPPRGLVWPQDEKGERSSTHTNKMIVAAAVGVVNQEKASKILRCKKWRFNYGYHLRGVVEEQCNSPEAALKIAQAGLNKAYELFEFVAEDGTTMSFEQAMKSPSKDQFYTGFIQGQGSKKMSSFEVPYKGGTLSGEALKKQVQKWVTYGTIEPSAGEAIIKCVENPQWLDMKDRYFVLLGAGSAMGPLLVLLALGANVVAIDLDRPQIWKRLITLARESSGTLTFPLKREQKSCITDDELFAQAGCNLFTHTPMIRDWLLPLYPGKPFTVGSYAYLDGALHVQVSLAMDAITRDLTEKRPNTSLAYLCTPTDLHLIPKEAHDAQVSNFERYSGKLYCLFLRLVSGGKLLRSNVKPVIRGQDGNSFYLVNGVSVAQGPNYALAKRMQHWRAIIARSKQGCVVSSNIAPSTSTVSVVHNRTFAWAYEGMPYFEPFEIFAPETSNAVMSALLLYDLNDSKSIANPKTAVSNPNQLFSYGSFHGGLWRCAYEVDSIGEASVLLYFSRLTMPYISPVVMVALGAIAYGYYNM